MKKIIYWLDMILTFIKFNIKKIMEYRLDFFLGVIPLIITLGIGILFIGLVFNQIPELNGWTFDEVLLIYSFYTLSSGVYLLFFDNLRNTKMYIFTGQLDTILIRPISPAFYILMLSFNEYSIGQILFGSIIMGYTLNKLAITISFATILLIIYFSILGGMILGAVNMVAVTFLFFNEGTFSPLSVVNSLQQFTKYPLTIFNKYIQVLLTWIIPLGFISFYPATDFLNVFKPDFSIILVDTIIVIILFTFAVKFFNYGLVKYKGTGN